MGKRISSSGGPNRSALLVIDVQQGLFEKSHPIYQAETLIENIKELAGKAHAAGAPVVYIQHSDEKSLVKGAPAWQLHPALSPAPQDFHIFKAHGNAFEDTGLGDLLRSYDIGTVIACGLVTHGCVKNTCLGGLEEGYRVILAKDAHSNYSKDAAELISKWNKLLAVDGVILKDTANINFG